MIIKICQIIMIIFLFTMTAQAQTPSGAPAPSLTPDYPDMSTNPAPEPESTLTSPQLPPSAEQGPYSLPRNRPPAEMPQHQYPSQRPRVESPGVRSEPVYPGSRYNNPSNGAALPGQPNAPPQESSPSDMGPGAQMPAPPRSLPRY